VTPPDAEHRQAGAQIVARFAAAARQDGDVRPVAVVGASRLEHGRAEARRARAIAAQGRIEEALGLLLEALEEDDRCNALRRAVWHILLDARHGPAARAELRRRIAARQTLVRAAAFHLATAVRCGEPFDARVVSTVIWTAAIQWLCDDLGPEALLPLARPLSEQFPEAGFLAELVSMLGSIPVAHPLDRFENDPDATLQFVPSVALGAETLLVCLSGDEGRFGVPHDYFHRWISGLPVHTLYLRDLSGARYRDGLAGIEGGHDAMIATIVALARELGVGRTAVIGNSNAGFAALRTGIGIGAGRITLFSPRGNRAGRGLDSEEGAGARRAALAESVAEIERRLASVTRTPAILCIHGDGNTIDRDVARAMADLPGIRQLPVHDFNRHNSILISIYRKRLAALLRWTVGLDAEPPTI
jgi:hypothetical protein